jgi:hypothetical protein
MYLKIICSWCQKFMGTKKCAVLNHEGSDITHSICPECKEKVMREMEEDFVQMKGGFKNER